MKMNLGLKLAMLGMVAILFAGCATRVNWDARVGHYTYDQAVIELGPPDKMARLTDGKVVADWVSRYSSPGTVFVGPGYYPTVTTYTPPTTFTDILRLTFSTNNVLCAWVKK
jgi:hypothetical protein